MRNLFEMLAERHGNSDGYDSLYGLTALSYTRMHTLYTGMDQNLVVQDQDKNVPYSDSIPQTLTNECIHCSIILHTTEPLI